MVACVCSGADDADRCRRAVLSWQQAADRARGDGSDDELDLVHSIAPEGVPHAFMSGTPAFAEQELAVAVGDDGGANDAPEAAFARREQPPTVPMFVRARLPAPQLAWFRTLAQRYRNGVHAILHAELRAPTAMTVVAHFAHVAEHYNAWGPFLIVAPSAAVRLWQATFEAVAPRLSVLPYWGEKRERQYMRRCVPLPL